MLKHKYILFQTRYNFYKLFSQRVTRIPIFLEQSRSKQICPASISLGSEFNIVLTTYGRVEYEIRILESV